jgi:hypothetical protein
MLKKQKNLKKYRPLFDDDFTYSTYLELLANKTKDKKKETKENPKKNDSNNANNDKLKAINDIINDSSFDPDAIVPNFMKLLCNLVESFSKCEGIIIIRL